MCDLTELINREIKKQYKSVRQFAMAIGVPQTTIVSALKKGVSGTSYVTVQKILETLHIEIKSDKAPILVDERAVALVEKFNSLDELGKHTVETITKVEHDRCTK